MSNDDHLSSDELAAAQDGKLKDPKRVEHLATCSACRRQVDDARWVTSLSGESDEQDTEHLDAEEIEAYRLMALPTERVFRIKRHLRRCSRCLAIYKRSRSLDEQADYPSTPGALLKQARRSFRSKDKRWLGTVLLTGLDAGPTAVLLPERRVASGEDLFAGDSDYRSPYREETDPGEASLKKRRAASPPRDRGGLLRRLFRRSSRQTPPPPETPLELDSFPTTMHSLDPLSLGTGEYRVHVLPAGPKASDRVTLQLVTTGDRRGLKGVTVKLRNKAGRRDEDRTDDEGRVCLTVPPGQSHVELGVKPPLVISFQRAD